MGQPQLSDQELYGSDMPVGEILRRARAHYGRSLEDIEKALRIRASQLDAIETGDFDKLPGRVYAIGFVRTYSEYLGLDGDQMVQIFKRQSSGKQSSPELHFPVAASDTKTPPVWLVASSLLVLMVISLFWLSQKDLNRDMVREVPAVSETALKSYGPFQNSDASQNEQVAQNDGAQEGYETQQATATEPAAGDASADASANITLTILQNSWVEIKDQAGEQIVSRVLKKGEVYYVPERPDLFMSLGNASGVELEIAGQTLQPLGKQGEVLRNIPLDRTYLLENFSNALDPSER